MLNEKSLTELRTIAQGLGVSGIFAKSQAHLIQEIEKKHKELIPPEKVTIPKPEYDARLMNRAPAKMCDKDALLELLKPYIERGLKVTIENEIWSFSYGKKNDTGTLRMPLKIALKKAEEVLS